MFTLLFLGSLFFPGVFLLCKFILRNLIGWSDEDAAVISTRCVSSLQAVMASLAGFVIVSSCRDVMEDRHWLAESYILFATPYFLYDIFSMYLCYRHRMRAKGHEEVGVASFLRREILLVLHHVAMVICCCPASLFWRQGRGDYFQGLLFLPELSTPFVSLGKVLIQYEKQHTLLHKLNGVLLLLSFFFCRVLLFPYLYYAYSRYALIPVYEVPLVAPWQCNLGAALLWLLQLHWFILISRGALRQTSSSPSRLAPDPTANHSKHRKEH